MFIETKIDDIVIPVSCLRARFARFFRVGFFGTNFIYNFDGRTQLWQHLPFLFSPKRIIKIAFVILIDILFRTLFFTTFNWLNTRSTCAFEYGRMSIDRAKVANSANGLLPDASLYLLTSSQNVMVSVLFVQSIKLIFENCDSMASISLEPSTYSNNGCIGSLTARNTLSTDNSDIFLRIPMFSGNRCLSCLKKLNKNDLHRSRIPCSS